MREMLAAWCLDARDELTGEVQPRDAFERAVIAALGEISLDEAWEAIKKHRDALNGD